MKGATIDSSRSSKRSRSSKHVVLCPDDDSAAADTIGGRGVQPKIPDLSKGTVARKPAKEIEQSLELDR